MQQNYLSISSITHQKIEKHGSQTFKYCRFPTPDDWTTGLDCDRKADWPEGEDDQPLPKIATPASARGAVHPEAARRRPTLRRAPAAAPAENEATPSGVPEAHPGEAGTEASPPSSHDPTDIDAPPPVPTAPHRDRVAGAPPVAKTSPEPTIPEPDGPRDAEGKRARRVPKSEHADPQDETDLLTAKEITLLAAARRALVAGEPRRARATLREHARKFRASALAPERDASMAEAHCAAGHPRAARPHLQRLERAGQARLAKQIRARCR
ncbi:MAG: hypothetical protein AAF721_25155 [Myxococcota bacterium]